MSRTCDITGAANASGCKVYRYAPAPGSRYGVTGRLARGGPEMGRPSSLRGSGSTRPADISDMTTLAVPQPERHADRADRNLRSHDRLLPQRRRLPASAQQVARHPGLAVPRMRHADQALRQRPGARLAAAARAVPHVSHGDLAALPGGRGTHRGARGRRDPRRAFDGGQGPRARARRDARPDRADRSRSPDHP